MTSTMQFLRDSLDKWDPRARLRHVRRRLELGRAHLERREERVKPSFTEFIAAKKNKSVAAHKADDPMAAIKAGPATPTTARAKERTKREKRGCSATAAALHDDEDQEDHVDEASERLA